MKYLFTLLLIGNFHLYSLAQNPGDTIIVQAFDWSMTALGNSGNRDMIVTFPNSGLTYEKIIMQYNMHCRNSAVNSSGGNYIACGEWDYSCNTYVHDSTRIDSVLATHPDFIISGFSGTSYDYTTSPTYTYLQQNQPTVTLNSIVSENQYPILAGTTPMTVATDGSNYSGKSQFVYTAAELSGAGFTAGDIDGMLLNAITAGDLHYFRVRAKQLPTGALDIMNPDVSGFTEVFNENYSFVVGSNRIQFFTPFVWDGTSDVIFEFSFTNSTPASAITIEGTASSNGLGIYAFNGIHTNLAANGRVEFPTAAMATEQSELSVSFWAKGDANLLPANTSVVYGVGAAGERDLNVHLPWSNSSIYFDCGNEGAGYDRINLAATAGEIAGTWHHWAFTKNATTGDMKIYLDGTLWHSGTGKTNLIDFANMIVGMDNGYNNNYKGKIDEVRVWNAELMQTEISNWMNISVDNTHPNYSDLIAYYKLDDYGNLSVTDASPVSSSGTTSSQYIWEYTRGKDLERFFMDATERPSIVLLQGIYNLTIDSLTVLDSLQNIPNTIDEYSVVSNAGTVYSDDLPIINTYYYWASTPQYIYDENGMLLDSIAVGIDGTITPTDLNYFNRRPMKFEIMSFVTPYGIGLDLGPDGKTWEFDLTDFSPVFKGDMRITMERGGQWNEDYDIKFLFIVGTPPRDIIDIQQIWQNDSKGYSSIVADNSFEPRDVTMNPFASSFKIRSAITGHGQEGEFIPRQHFVDIDGGVDEFSWQVWKECAENPIYPQGGTWIYDRAGWCPGRATDLQEWDITPYVTPGQTHTIDYGIVSAAGTSNYIVNQQLVSYDTINNTVDATIADIINPSTYVEHFRVNEICANPTVVLRNTGGDSLTSAVINYWVNGDPNPFSYAWTGSLGFLEEEEVSVPTTDAFWYALNPGGPNTFHAQVVEVNGSMGDDYALNDHRSAMFEIPDVLPGHFYIQFKTNNAGAESTYHVEDDAGNILMSRSGLSNNTIYKDTLDLSPGCYKLVLNDSDDDGFNFWANSDGNGSMFLREVGGIILTYINGDFGKSYEYSFTVDYPLSYEEIYDKFKVELYPNPASNEFILAAGSISEYEVKVLNSTGEEVNVPKQISMDEITFDSSQLAPGIYLVKVLYRGQLITKKMTIR